MSLSIYLEQDKPIEMITTGIYVRENGVNRELTLAEAKERFPNATDIEERVEKTYTLYSDNITHNLNTMAEACGLYNPLWRPFKLLENYSSKKESEDEDYEYDFEISNSIYAKQLVEHLEKGLLNLIENEVKLKELNPTNGWGTYEGLVKFTKNYLNACKQYPESKVITCR